MRFSAPKTYKMAKVLIHPWASRLRVPTRDGSRDGSINAKSYNQWPALINMLDAEGIETIQIGRTGEAKLNTTHQMWDLPLREIKRLLFTTDTFVTVDSFLQHLAHSEGKTGIVIWSQSDPNIFGYPDNINLLKDRRYLRPDQFGYWHNCQYNPNAFVDAQIVCDAILKKIGQRGTLIVPTE